MKVPNPFYSIDALFQCVMQFIPDGAGHLTEASSKWKQLCDPIGVCLQDISLDSVPVHSTSSIRIGPVPWPKKAKRNADAPEFNVGNLILFLERMPGIMEMSILEIQEQITLFCTISLVWGLLHLPSINYCSQVNFDSFHR